VVGFSDPTPPLRCRLPNPEYHLTFSNLADASQIR
jgi:hypothetical protein